jgi:citrate synthase
MDRIFLLHADHEQNASTSTVRLAGSTGANPFAVSPPASGAVGTWCTGAERSGAQPVERNRSNIKNVDKFKRAKDKNDSFRLMAWATAFTKMIRARK